MFQLRIYTLRTEDALDRYASVHWARHISSLDTFGVTTYGVWTERANEENRLFALISYADGANPEELTSEYLASAEFKADMKGFDPQDMLDVETILLDATAASPMR
ncbi:MAG: NIPSNAP family protein [Mycobacterium sp.]|uniref:NIPSNAP family protein n=1 Tax=Mycobacterium sp. TaxID=1785 RepID=UPI003BB0E59E